MAVDRTWQRISWLILGIGGLLLLGGLALGWGSLRHVLHADRADGEVIELRPEGDMHAPVVRFRLANGEVREGKDLGSGAPEYAIGDRVTVLYMPEDPDDFRIDSFARLWFGPIALALFAGFWLIFGGIAWGLAYGVDLAVLGENAFAAIAIVAALLGAVALWDAAGLYLEGARTEGRVAEVHETRRTEQEEVTRADGSVYRRDVQRTSYAPVIRFTDRTGRDIEFHGRAGSDRGFAPGDRVSVVYDPGNPIRARIISFVDLWLPAAAAFAVVVAFGGAAWLSRRLRRRSTGRNA